LTSGVVTSGQLVITNQLNWNFTPVQRKVKPITISQVRLTAKVPPRDQMAPTEYVALALSVGVRSAAVDQARVEAMIEEMQAPVYDFAAVDDYLYAQASQHGQYAQWVWKPARESDVEALQRYPMSVHQDGGYIYASAYSRAIPERVLMTMAKVLEKIPDAIPLISDYETIKPDPFLAITTARLAAQGKVYIIDQWDEPGFSAPGSGAAALTAPRAPVTVEQQ
jgi:hypothetical protein